MSTTFHGASACTDWCSWWERTERLEHKVVGRVRVRVEQGTVPGGASEAAENKS